MSGGAATFDVSGYPRKLPAEAQRKLGELNELNTQHEMLEEQYEEERKALEKKYQALYDPLYAKRSGLVGAGADASGIPKFWFVAMMNCEVVAEAIMSKDHEALESLSDVQCILLEDSMSFRLVFKFAPNEFFTNSALEKTYHLVDDDEPILEKAEGCDIQWKAGKNLTMKTMKKKVPAKGKGQKPVIKTKTVRCDSFFNFFSPPDLEELEELAEEEEEEMHEVIQSDFEIGAAFRERLVPHAVLWFTGEAVDMDYDEEEDEDEDRGGSRAHHGGGGEDEEDDEAQDEEENTAEECKQQ